MNTREPLVLQPLWGGAFAALAYALRAAASTFLESKFWGRSELTQWLFAARDSLVAPLNSLLLPTGKLVSDLMPVGWPTTWRALTFDELGSPLYGLIAAVVLCARSLVISKRERTTKEPDHRV